MTNVGGAVGDWLDPGHGSAQQSGNFQILFALNSNPFKMPTYKNERLESSLDQGTKSSNFLDLIRSMTSQ